MRQLAVSLAQLLAIAAVVWLSRRLNREISQLAREELLGQHGRYR